MMGEGAYDAGGYEVDYDPHLDAFERGEWLQRNGVSIAYQDMSLRHLQNAKRIAEALSQCQQFESDNEKWQEIADALQEEIQDRQLSGETRAIYKCQPKPVRGLKQTMICHCGNEYKARTADIKRGWALSCSKSCAAVRRDYGRPAAKPKQDN